MRQTYAFEVIDTFSPEETEAFRRFLDSPYFNNSYQAAQYKALFELLLEARQHPGQEYLERARVYERLFPGGRVVAGKLDKLLSEFKKLLQTFLLTQRYLNSDNGDNHVLELATDLRQRNLLDKYEQALERARKHAMPPGPESLRQYAFRLKLAQEEHERNCIFNKARGDLNIPHLIDQLDQYYFANRLELLNRLLLQGTITLLPTRSVALAAEPWSIPAAYLESGNIFRIPWRIRTMLLAEAPTIGDFEAIHELLRSQESRIDPEHLKEYYAYVRNACTFLMDFKGHIELRPVLFEIQRDNLARGYFYHQGKIPPNAMLNITQIAVLLRELDWANTFIEQHKDRIMGENETRDFYRMNKALCLFEEKQYEAALEIIPFGTSYSYFHLMARRVELKIYYELDSGLLPHKMDAFKAFIRRAGNKLLSRRLYEIHLQFIHILEQLSASPKTRARARSEQLIRRIQAKKMIGERQWLLEKARELRGRTV